MTLKKLPVENVEKTDDCMHTTGNSETPKHNSVCAMFLKHKGKCDVQRQ